MFNKGRLNLLISPHLNQNYHHSFPGIEMLLFEYPVHIKTEQFYISPRIIADIQPKHQNFMETKGEFSGLVEINLAWKTNKNIYPYISIGRKNYGWIKGNVFINKSFDFKTGISIRFE